MRVAVPPDAGSVQMLPCRSTASVRPSGETATDIDVPSVTVTSIGDGAARAPPHSTPAATMHAATAKPTTTVLRLVLRSSRVGHRDGMLDAF
jgi:hypothetical protein